MAIKTSPAFHVLIPAAGSGTRTGLSLPKQYRKIGGKMILRHTVEKFIQIQGLKSIRVIIDPEHAAFYAEAMQGLDIAPPVFGAKTRKQSVYNGLSAFSPSEQEDMVLIHDAARLFVSQESIYALLDAMSASLAATLAMPIADTLVDADYNPFDRDKISAVQTPQAFKINLLKKAHDFFRNDDRFTDDAGLIAAIGENVALIPGTRDNFKITTNEDMQMAERLLLPQLETRTGFGYDVHAFDPAPADKIRLGGIDIPYEKKLLGHSDADVVLHALTDALLGTIGEGDIGQLFPPSDMQWKNADSEIFLKEAVRRVRAREGRIIHADITVIAEAPKIGPHREAMQVRIAGMLGIEPSRVGLKATTSEGLGFTGRKEGIVAQAVASVAFPAA
ncbi:MAG: bifunctional 2-C-methyl-D-erythritol 4-phosphate cytidylyltransferase/2-C-methyl-D-erythritol 2,4-cyclodiphosphate synthase [Micavibrio aeruginosavorus]|uniref:Bifunctional enzyme IspD/IspF n=1 Tax=Micavibrio aeruginosavorus TaxID=349221 RepID=A0A2W5PZU3_9BACT|nr:MAG: bifunctional 2-C-methyl-D-erythritol 4-phosphate cytidylyltransferase/2-C-methyl-D-erythritol 2,4-cyclodiphosphate synthase [Micavibrio aeruginosavorus]